MQTLSKNIILFASLSMLQSSAFAYEPAAASTENKKQYTFAWPYTDAASMAPRGGTSKGAPVALAKAPTQAWLDLQQAKPSDKDRAAILAMAGSFRASFDFVEVAGFTPEQTPQRPYQSWGTERVVVLEAKPEFISLQHVLVMRMQDKDGKLIGPFVTKHWRQDWHLQPRWRFDYVGAHQWRGKAINPQAGSWMQCVYQVDDSPRYCGVGSWQHSGNYSSWLSDEGARPLPRREWSVRKDYSVLVGTNRHTITPSGWIHEQQNNKVTNFQEKQVIAREFGLNRYEAIGDDLALADRYVQATEPLWSLVRARWAELLRAGSGVTLKAAPDEAQLFMPLFAKAEALQAKPDAAPSTAEVQALIADYLAPQQAAQVMRYIEQPLPDCTAQAAKACDQAAIRQMAGDFEVRFSFAETVPLAAGYQRQAPSDSLAYEHVRVLQDTPEKISLQHVLLSSSGRVTKHWRQDWIYELPEHWAFQGAQGFGLQKRDAKTVAGTWTQLVYDVADAPRYAGSGRWNHKYGVATWTSDRTWRPLPRREYTTRTDYDLINAENRHTVTPSGWTHEQDNSKVVRRSALDRTLVREFGFNEYRRIAGFDFAPARQYLDRTEPFWRAVRDAWQQALAEPTLRLCYAADDEKPGQALFASAEKPVAQATQAIGPWMQQHVNCEAAKLATRR
jgi:hypothetical protein